MVYNGKSQSKMGENWGYPHDFRKTPNAAASNPTVRCQSLRKRSSSRPDSAPARPRPRPPPPAVVHNGAPMQNNRKIMISPRKIGDFMEL